MKTLIQQILDAKDMDNLLIQGLSQTSTVNKVLGINLTQVEKTIREENDNFSIKLPNGKTNYRQK